MVCHALLAYLDTAELFRAHTADLVAVLAGPEHHASLLRLAHDPDPWVRRYCQRALVPSASAFRSLSPRLSHPELELEEASEILRLAPSAAEAASAVPDAMVGALLTRSATWSPGLAPGLVDLLVERWTGTPEERAAAAYEHWEHPGLRAEVLRRGSLDSERLARALARHPDSLDTLRGFPDAETTAVETLALPLEVLLEVEDSPRLIALARGLATDTSQPRMRRYRALRVWCELTGGERLPLEPKLASLIEAYRGRQDPSTCEDEQRLFQVLRHARPSVEQGEELLSATVPALRVIAITTLHGLGCKVDLQGFTRDSAAQVRITALRLLAAVDPIRPYLQDGDACIQATAVHAIAELAPDREVFERVLRGPAGVWEYYQPAREEAACGLAQLDDPEAHTALLQVALTPEHDELHVVIARCLAAIAKGRALPRPVWRLHWLGLR